MAGFGKGLGFVFRARGVTGKIKLKKIDRGLDRIKRVLRSVKADKSYVKAGLIGKANKQRSDGSGLTNVQLGVIHEFGTATVPARPFISAAFRRHRAEYQELLRRLGAGVYSGKMDYPRALGIVGQKMAADMKNYVTAGPQIPPPNAPATLARKQAKGQTNAGGGPRTLVDTGAMVGSITYEVVTRGSGQEQEP